jgi:hypothetical protein
MSGGTSTVVNTMAVSIFFLEFLVLAMGWKNVNPVIEGKLYLGK